MDINSTPNVFVVPAVNEVVMIIFPSIISLTVSSLNRIGLASMIYSVIPASTVTLSDPGLVLKPNPSALIVSPGCAPKIVSLPVVSVTP